MSKLKLLLVLSLISCGLQAQKKSTKKDITIDKLLVMEKVPAMKTSEFPKVKFRQPKSVTYMALQFGPKATDVLYIAYDKADIGKPYDIIYLQSPGIIKYTKAVKLKLKKKEKKRKKYKPIEYYHYPKLRIKTVFGKVKVDYTIAIQAFITGNNSTRAWITAVYKSSGKTCKLSMTTINASRTAEETDTFFVVPLAGKKEFHLRGNAKKKFVKTQLRIGHIQLHPMKRKSFISVDMMQGEKVVEQQKYLLVSDEFFTIDTIFLKLEKSEEGKYALRLKCDLGPLFKPIVYSDKKLFEL